MRGGVFPAIEAVNGRCSASCDGFTWRGGRHLGCTSANIAYHVRQIRRCYENGWEAGPDAPASRSLRAIEREEMRLDALGWSGFYAGHFAAQAGEITCPTSDREHKGQCGCKRRPGDGGYPPGKAACRHAA